jgi:hypothetical protein
MVAAIIEGVGELWLKLSKQRPKRYSPKPGADDDAGPDLPRLTKRRKRDDDGQK